MEAKEMRHELLEYEWNLDVGVATERPLTEDEAEELLGVLSDMGALGTAIGTSHEMVSAAFNLEGQSIAAVADEAEGIMLRALDKIGLDVVRVEHLQIRTLEELDRELAQPAETYVGVSEIAETLSVSKQRVSELRRLDGFPIPMAELAAGPVWKRSSLQRFIDTWERKPGRPRKDVVRGTLRVAEG